MKTKTTLPRHLMCAALASLTLSSVALADTTTTTTRTTTAVDRPTVTAHSQLSSGDKRFVEKVAKIGLEEVAISRLAVERASREEVRAFARAVVADHEKSDADLSMLASNKGIVLPVAEKTNLDRWAKKTGKDFDEDYLEKIIDGHKDAVDAMESNARKAEDTDVAAYARNHLATMEEHLRKAKELKKMVD